MSKILKELIIKNLQIEIETSSKMDFKSVVLKSVLRACELHKLSNKDITEVVSPFPEYREEWARIMEEADKIRAEYEEYERKKREKLEDFYKRIGLFIKE